MDKNILAGGKVVLVFELDTEDKVSLCRQLIEKLRKTHSSTYAVVIIHHHRPISPVLIATKLKVGSGGPCAVSPPLKGDIC